MRLLEVQKGVTPFWCWAAVVLLSLAGHVLAVWLAVLAAEPVRARDVPVATAVELVDLTDEAPGRAGLPAAATLEAHAPEPIAWGPADLDASAPASPWPRADVSTPDPLPAAHGGGGEGGAPLWTGRRDDDTLRAQAWNDPQEYRLGRHRTGRRRTSPEAVVRSPDPGLDALTRPHRRRPGVATPGAERAVASWEGEEPWPTEGVPGRQAVDAAVGSPVHALTRKGDVATEATTRGVAMDNVEAAQASSETHPEAFELTHAQSGGHTGEGVLSARPGDGISALALGSQGGEGGTPADVERELGGHPSMRARPQNAYFRRLYDRVFARVSYPRELALGLEQGELIVELLLDADGSLARVQIARSSGFRAFDEAILSAVSRAAPFGRVPEALRGGRAELTVRLPFKFDNPLIR
jgi:TonB family protein